MKTRIGVVAALVVLLIGGIAVRMTAQGAQPAAKAESTLVEREYDLRGLLGPEPTTDGPRDLLATCLYQSPDPNSSDFGWNFARLEGPGMVTEEDEFVFLAHNLAESSECDSAKVVREPFPRLKVNATESLHARLAATLGYLRNMMEARIRIEIRRLDALPARVVQEKGDVRGKLIASREVANGEFALVSNVSRTRIAWTAEAQMHGDVPRVADYLWGEQWGLSALIMPDGRIRMQAWHGGVTNEGLRERVTRTGKLQFPTARWDMTPAGANVQNGGGFVLDTAAGAYLVTATTTATLPNVKLDDGVVSLWNPAGSIPAGRFTAPWALSAAGEIAREMDAQVFLPQGAEYRDLQQVTYPAYPGAGTAVVMNELTERLTGNWTATEPLVCGSLFGLRLDELSEGDDQERALRPALDATLNELCRGPKHHEVRVRLLQVPTDATLPEGVLAGKPSGADIAALTGAVGIKPVFDRRVTLASGQESDLIALKLENYLAGFSSASYTGEAPDRYDTKVYTHPTGVQVRVRVEDNGHVHVVVGWRHSSQMHEFKPGGDLDGETMERPEWKDVVLIVADAVVDGGALSNVQPVDDKTMAVLLVERREEQ